jgi:signal transduction histidine kinase
VLAGILAVYGAVVAVVLQPMLLPLRQIFVWYFVAAVWLLGLPVIGLIAWFVRRWAIHEVQSPIVAMIERAREIQDYRAAGEVPRGKRANDPRGVAAAVHELLSDLDQTMVQQHRFVADVAHELRTPLTAQVVVGENALSRKATAAELREAVGSMLEEAKHMKQLIEGLLELMRSSLTQAKACHTSPLNLSELAEGCVRALQVLAEEKQQVMSVMLGGPMWANVDPTMIRQALLNVIHNAIEHCPQGARIHIETVQAADGECLIRVNDNGPGIPCEDQPRVFERFYRGSGSSRRRGLGLGLSIAKAILRSHGGGIQLSSVPGAGCCFTLILPLMRKPPVCFEPQDSAGWNRAAVRSAIT